MIGAVLVALLVALIVAAGAYVAGKRGAAKEAKEHELDLTLKRELEAETDRLKAEAQHKANKKIAGVPAMTDEQLESEINK